MQRPPPLPRGALARAKRGEQEWGWPGSRGVEPGTCTAGSWAQVRCLRPAPVRSVPPRSRAAPGRPGARSLPGRAARAMAAAALASGAPFGPALELLPGQPAPARARPVSAGPAPRSWFGSAPGSRPTRGAAGAVRRPGNRGAAQSGGAGGTGRERNGFDIPQTCAGRGNTRATVQARAQRWRRGVHRALCAATNVQHFHVPGFYRAGYVRGGS